MLRRIFCNEAVVMLVIVANAIAITWMYFPAFREHRFLDIFDKLCTLFFVVEAVVKIATLGAQGYFRSGWNRFDFTIVLLSTPSLFAEYLPLPDTSVLLLFRLLRLIRLLRFIQFVPHIEKILAGLGRALRASLLVMIVLFMLNFLLAIITCHFYGELVPEYFGDPLVSMYSIFQMFTVEGWNEIPAAIAAVVEGNGDPHSLNSIVFVNGTRFYFGTVVLLGGIFGLSLANAVFVDEMTIDNNDDILVKIEELQRQLSELQETLNGRANNSL
ncbi:MAG TPA: ion transporter [Pirellulaceae bacterium]|nr:ion transporter [Pirellulaceae bacterium]HMO93170.1 ion transporter [Pirellulaceae bacterium]HMP70001.1 ion transporter [Pirellulaceae bacterium]